MGTYSKDNYETGSKAALVGGTTTLIEMCCPSRTRRPARASRRGEPGGRQIACDFTFHMGVTKFDDRPRRNFAKSWRGHQSFKIFLAYKGAFGIDDDELYRTLKLAKELGVVTAHCENETLVAETLERLLAQVSRARKHHESRPPRVEAEGVHHL